MKILALDPATHCGFAHSCGISGTWDLSVRRDESSGMRLIRLRGKLDEILRDVGVDSVVYEVALQMLHRRAGASVQSEIQGVLKLWCEDNKIEYRSYSPTEIKKHATGKGNAGKPAMIDAAVAKWKRVFQDHQENEVDALWLLDLALKDFI